ncbi:MAG TPA: tetratricopeptide repeat protein [Afifellaceae bacterium]|nr:tetratricopeptide repeat protein [Afifellaceae bacterium]
MLKNLSGRLFAPSLVAVSILVAGLPDSSLAVSSDDEVELNSLSGIYLAARIADAGRDFSSAGTFYRAAFQNDPENLFLLDRSMVLTAAEGRIEEAKPFADQLAKKVPNNHAALLLQAVTSLRGKKYAEAISNYEKANGSVLKDLSKALVIGWTEFGRGEVDKAIAVLDAADGQPWYSVYTDLHSGYILAAAGRAPDALSRFETAYKQNRNAVLLADAYARALYQAGKMEEAQQVVDDFRQRFPDNPLMLKTAAAMASEKPLPAAIRTPVEGVAAALADIGLIIGQEGSLEISAFYYRLSLYLEPQLAGGLTAMSFGNVLESNQRFEEAIAIYEAIDPDAPYRKPAMLRDAISLNRLDRSDEAAEVFEEVLQGAGGEDVQVLIAYGNMERGRERHEEASKLYTRAINLIEEPTRQDWSLFYSRGITYERTDRWPKAEADFQKALELFPDQPLVLNYLGYSWIDMGINLEPALEMIRKAVQLRPNDGYIVDSLGWAFYRLGRYEEAVVELERAVSLRANDPIINDHLGDAFWKVDRILEAQFQWRHARDLGAKDEELVRINKKIEQQTLIEEDIKPEDEKRGDLLGDPVNRAALATSGNRRL